MDVFIRPLEENDAYISYRWRNDPGLWKHTGSRPNREITPEIEIEWIREVLQRKDEKRFAICVCREGGPIYVGNIYLTNIQDGSGEFHIFIGDKAYWNRGIGKQATRTLLEYAKSELGLLSVWLEVSSVHTSAIRVYEQCGFSSEGKASVSTMIRMTLCFKKK